MAPLLGVVPIDPMSRRLDVSSGAPNSLRHPTRRDQGLLGDSPSVQVRTGPLRRLRIVGPGLPEHVARRFKMEVVCRLGLVGVTAAERHENRDVEVGDSARVHARDSESDECSGKRFEIPPDPLKSVVAGELDDAAVERDVDNGLRVGVACVGRLLHFFDVALELFEVGLRHQRQSKSRAERFELRSNPVGLEQLGFGWVSDASAPIRRNLDDPETFEVA